MPDQKNKTHLSTGVAGLDSILGSGLPRNRLYLIDGEPGTGKTTLALQFLLEGARNGERGLYVTLSETREELEAVAQSHGWGLENIDVYELPSVHDMSDESYTLFHPAEVELQQTVEAVLDAVKRANPQRVVFDSLSEMRLLARDPLRFRRQILALKQFFAGRECTILLLDDKTAPEGDLQLHSLAHGVIALEHVSLEYGSERRRMKITKLRGQNFRGGYHDFRIETGGIAVFPRILSNRPQKIAPADPMTSGSEGLDRLLGGGLVRGSSILITGAAGTGKSILATQYASAALERGERVQFYLFDERAHTFLLRAQGLGMDLDSGIANKSLRVQQIEPTELSPGEFANQIVRAVEEDGVTLIVLDSVNGYMQSMPEERLLPIQVHELLSYLANNGVTMIMTLVQRGIFGSPVAEEAEVSYLADTVILLRYFEVQGAVRQAISVVKKRSGTHERTIREARVGVKGLQIGEPLSDFQGVLTGVPAFVGERLPHIVGEHAPVIND